MQPGWKESSEGCIDWKHTKIPTVERVLAFLYFGDYQSPEPVPRSKSDQPLEPNELREGADTTYVESDAFEREGELQNGDVVAIETDYGPVVEAPGPEPEPEPSTAAVKDGEDEDLELQKALLESHSVRPLTPLGRCVGFPTIETIRKTAGIHFNGDDFPYMTSHTKLRCLFMQRSLRLRSTITCRV